MRIVVSLDFFQTVRPERNSQNQINGKKSKKWSAVDSFQAGSSLDMWHYETSRDKDVRATFLKIKKLLIDSNIKAFGASSVDEIVEITDLEFC